MRKVLQILSILLLLLLINSFDHSLEAQCTGDVGQPPTDFCDDAPVLCTIDEIQNYCLQMTSGNTGGAQPTPLCPGTNSTANNIFWFSFVASTNNIQIELNIYDCTSVPDGGGNLVQGVQYGIYEDCSFATVVDCDGGANTGVVQFGSNNFIPGNTYVIFVDGFAGSACTVEFTILQGLGEYMVDDPGGVGEIFDGSSFDPPLTGQEVCVGGDITFSVNTPDGSNAIDYNWTISPGTTDYPDGLISDEGQSSVIVHFDTPGFYDICSFAYTDCDSSDVYCQTVEVVQVADEVFDDFEVCEGEFPTSGPPGWLGPPITGPGLNTHMAEDPVYSCDYTQVVNVIQNDLQPPESIEVTVCNDGAFGTYQVCDQIFTQSTPTQGVLVDCPNADQNGCDSTVQVIIVFINVINQLQDPICSDGQLNFDWIGTVPNPGPFTNITYNLFLDNVLIFTENAENFNINTESFPAPIEGGTYYLQILVEQFGEICEFNSSPISVNVDNLLPQAPPVGMWAVNPCIQDSVTYQLGSSANPNLDYIWTVTPSTNLGISGLTGTSIGINWENGNPNTTYEICVTADNGCGLSPQICEEINLLAQPIANYTGPDTICITDLAQITYDGSVITNGDYTWNFGGGDIGGADSNSAGPFDVGFATSGNKIISVSVNQGTCVSEVFVDSVQVVTPLAAPVINCTSATDSIGFSWDDLADGYIVNVITAPGTAVFDQGIGTFNVTGLAPNDEVTIEVIALDNGFCPNVPDTITCIAQNCPPVDISIGLVDTICLDAGAAQVDLNAVIMPFDNNAVQTWSGPGIVDADAGTFDPVTATPGEHQIVLDYVTDCSYSSSIVIVVLEQPVSTFNATDTICITDEADINYTGTFANGDFTWDFEDGTEVGTGNGPYTVSWTTPGLKTISTSVENEGCASEVYSETILVQEELTPPLIDCNSQTNDVTFDWNAVVNATGYEITINGEVQDTINGTSYFVDGLEPGNVVEIVVTAFSNNMCADVSTFASCEAASCPPVILSITADETSFCLDNNTTSINLTGEAIGGDPAASLTWSGTAVNANGDFDPAAAGPGIHEVYLNYLIDNCESVDTIVMTVNQAPVSSFTTQDVICVTDTFFVDFDGSFDTAATFDWSTSGGNISGVEPGPYKIWFNAAGTYDLSLTLSEFGCDSETFTQNVTVEPELTLPNPGFSCDATTSSISFSWPDVPCASGYTIFVDGNEVSTQSTTEYSVDNLDPDENVDFEIIAISECACGDETFSINCTTLACPVVNVDLQDQADICLDDSAAPVQLSVDVTGATGDELVSWIGDGVNNSGLFNPVIVGPGVHQIEYLLFNDNCNYSDVITINVFEAPTAEVLFTDPSCPGDENGSIEVTATNGSGEYSIFINDELINGNAVANLPGANYTIDVVDGNGCSYSEVVTLIQPGDNPVGIQGSTSIIAGDSNSYSINIDVPVNEITNIVWSDSTGTVLCQGIDCATLDFAPQEDLRLCVLVEYGDGCTTEDCIDVRVEQVRQVYIPNIFSPDGDGVNDVFLIFPNDEIVEMPLMQVYNRWGEKMFEATDIALDGTGPNWDGTFRGNKLNPGVYVYQLFVVYKDGTPETISGDLTISR